MTRGLDLKIGSVPPPAPNAGHPAGSSSANCHARHDIAVVEQIVQLELHIPGAQAEVGHGIHRGVARQGDRVAGVGEPRSHIVQAPPRPNRAPVPGHPQVRAVPGSQRGPLALYRLARIRRRQDSHLAIQEGITGPAWFTRQPYVVCGGLPLLQTSFSEEPQRKRVSR